MSDGSGCEPGACQRPGRFGGMCPDCAGRRRNELKRIRRVPVIEAREQARAAAKDAAPLCTAEECFRRGRKGGLCAACRHREEMARKRRRRAAEPAVKAREADQRRRHYERHREEVLAKGRRWREEHPDWQRERWAAWYAEHREEHLAYLASPEQRERMNAWARADRAANPEKWREKNRRERQGNERYTLRAREASRRRQVGTTYSRILYSTVLERDGMVCHLCGGSIESLADLHFDHVIPLAKGGEHTVENVSCAHALCNLRKSDRLI